MSRRSILVIEDDKAIRRGIVDTLAARGFETLEADEARMGLKLAVESTIDLVLLDVMLPHGDGFDILQAIRKARPSLPIIMVTARGAESDRVRGLEGGADDYIIKPFGVRELMARVDAVLRRSAERPIDVHELCIGERTIDFAKQMITSRNGDDPCALSRRECDLLRYLVTNPSRAVARDELLQHVWGLDPNGIETRTVDMHMARLRAKLGTLPDGSPVVQTIRGKGYMLAPRLAPEVS